MPSCRIEKKLPTCDVDIKLLALVQNNYKSICKQYLNIDMEAVKPGGYSIRIVDDFGVETFSSVEEIPYESFSDGVNRIDVDLSAYSSSLSAHLKIETCFSSDRLFSKTLISFSGEHARSSVVAIHDKIIQVVSTKQNNNYLYNPTNFAGSIIFAISLFPMWLGLPIYKLGPRFFMIGFFTMLITWGYLYYGKRLKPYCCFDSPSADRRAKLADWLVKGGIGFLLFSTLMPFARKAIFGF